MPKTYAQIGSDFRLWFQNDVPSLRNLEEIDQRTFEPMIESAFSLTDQLENDEFNRFNAIYSQDQINAFEIRIGKQVLEWRNSNAVDFLNNEIFVEDVSHPDYPRMNSRLQLFFDQNTVEKVITSLDQNVFGTRSPEPVNQEKEITNNPKPKPVLESLLGSFIEILECHTEPITDKKNDAYERLEQIAGEILEHLKDVYENESKNQLILKHVKPILKPHYGRTKSISGNTLKTLFALSKHGIF